VRFDSFLTSETPAGESNPEPPPGPPLGPLGPPLDGGFLPAADDSTVVGPVVVTDLPDRELHPGGWAGTAAPAGPDWAVPMPAEPGSGATDPAGPDWAVPAEPGSGAGEPVAGAGVAGQPVPGPVAGEPGDALPPDGLDGLDGLDGFGGPRHAAPAAPVFTDLSGRRLQLMRALGIGAALALLAFLVVGAVGMLGGPRASFIPWKMLDSGKRPAHPAGAREHARRGPAGVPTSLPMPSAMPSAISGSFPASPPAPGSAAVSSPASPSVTATVPVPTVTNPAGHTPPGKNRTPKPVP
jgi:hypothetical protein